MFYLKFICPSSHNTILYFFGVTEEIIDFNTMRHVSKQELNQKRFVIKLTCSIKQKCYKIILGTGFRGSQPC